MAVTSLVKRKNMLQVLDCFRQYSKLTKQELSEHTTLTAGTINTFVNELLAQKIVIEDGLAISTGGRKASIYSLNPKSLYTIGISMGVEHISIGIFDFAFNLIAYANEKVKLADNLVEKIVQVLADKIEYIIDKNAIGKKDVAGVGISVPGPVDYSKGTVLELPHIKGWKNVPLGALLGEKLDLPIVVDNDNNANVLHIKSNRENSNIVYLSTVEGIGVGVIIDGKVYRGSRYFAGEIGHVSINPCGEQCSCGNFGCIELYASNLGIVNSAKAQAKKLGLDKEAIGIDWIIESAKGQNSFSIQLLEQAVDHIALCIDNIVKAYDPALIVLDSTWLQHFPTLINRLMQRAYERTDFITREDIRIEIRNEDKLFLQGAASLIFCEQFNDENADSLLWKKLS